MAAARAKALEWRAVRRGRNGETDKSERKKKKQTRKPSDPPPNKNKQKGFSFGVQHSDGGWTPNESIMRESKRKIEVINSSKQHPTTIVDRGLGLSIHKPTALNGVGWKEFCSISVNEVEEEREKQRGNKGERSQTDRR